MSRAKVYLNGAYIGEWPYIPLSFELTKQIQYGKENILSVRLENKEESSRWYPGAGTEMRLVKRSVFGWRIGNLYYDSYSFGHKGEVNIKTEIDGNVEMNLLPKFMTPKGKK
jgi:beta-galactosidase